MDNQEMKVRSFDKVVWLFIICSLIGLVSEGSYAFFITGHWESHVITLLTPLCPIYGLGAVLFFAVDHKLGDKNIFLKAGVIGIFATLMELLCGLMLYYCFKMRAWNYLDAPINVKGVICPEFMVIWALFGLAYLLVNKLYKSKVKHSIKAFCTKPFHIVTIVVAVFVFFDMLFAWITIGFWSSRHYGNPVDNTFEIKVESVLPDDYMEERFIEWKFLDDLGEI